MKYTTLFLMILPLAEGFAPVQPRVTSAGQPLTSMFAKKKRGKSTGQGFGKKTEAAPQTASKSTESGGSSPESIGFSSIEGASQDANAFARPKVDLDPNMSTDERTKAILKQQFGLRSYEEQQGDIKAAEAAAVNRSRLEKVKQMKDEEFDIFMVIPPSIVKAIDAFLKLGLTVSTVAFVLAGIGITAEAWAIATDNKLPENIDNFIVNVIEPNFTPGLLVLLSFSVCLGIFATAQLASGSSIYKEEP